MQIYKITNLINNKIYIGKDTTSDAKYFGSGLLIKRAFKKYGSENFIKEVIDTSDDYNELSKKEIYWITFYNSTDKKIGYNISNGGDGGDTLSNHPDLEIIKEKISKNNPKKGKTYEEAFGEEISKKYKENLSKSNTRHNLGKKLDELYSSEKSERIRKSISNSSKINWTPERKKLHSNFAKNNIYKSLLSDKSIEKNRNYLNERWSNWRNTEIKIIESLNIEDLVSYLNKIPNSLFSNRSDFYKFIGNDKHELIKKNLLKNRIPNKNNESNKKSIIIDNINYESILEATKKLNIDRSLIRSRLKSSHFKNYLYQDEELNKKYKKFIEVDPHFSKKEPISIEGKEYESITQASKDLKKPNDYINWRLNSKSYPDWFYLNKEVELKETGDPKMKKVSIIGNEYDSIADAVVKSGINRQIMRYRLRSNNYPDYFYI